MFFLYFCRNVKLFNMATKESFKETDKLYHFTTFDSAKKIIESNSLRFGRLNNMNDIHETSKSMFAKSNMQEFPEELLNELYNEIYRYRQISLTQDTQDKCGFDLHNMWGLYANKFDGVCLVFDKNKLLEFLDEEMPEELKQATQTELMTDDPNSEQGNMFADMMQKQQQSEPAKTSLVDMAQKSFNNSNE